MATLNSNKFKIGDYVFLRDDEEPWFVSGLTLQCGYDIYFWEYTVSRPAYLKLDIESPVRLMWKCDFDTKMVREEELITVDERDRMEAERLRKQKGELEAKLADIDKRLKGGE